MPYYTLYVYLYWQSYDHHWPRPPLTDTFDMELAHAGCTRFSSLFIHCLQVSVFPLCNFGCLPWYCLYQLISYAALRHQAHCNGDCSNWSTIDATLLSRSLLQALVLSSSHGFHGYWLDCHIRS